MADKKPTHWADIQQMAFTRWVNEHLKDRGMRVENLATDLCDGIKLIHLLEIISDKSLGRYNKHPKIISQKFENTSICMKFLEKEGVKLVNIGNEDITNGKLKLIMGLIWTLILRYQIVKGNGDAKSAKNALLEWVRSKIPEYNIQGFTKDWNDGRAICGLVNALRPGLIPNHQAMNPADSENNATKGIDTAYDRLGVARLILPNEMVNPKVDEQAMMTYISQFRDLPLQEEDPAEKCSAYGPGLVEGIVGQPAEFTVVNPSGRGNLEVKVFGPKDPAKVDVKKNPDGTYAVAYHPTTPGEYKVHVTLDGKHIPGSIFTVIVLQEESIGGEGKILVFYTTTSANNFETRPMQELLERKQIHLRPDFEPWIPVDLMLRDDREAVFRKAGTRNLPIVYIDDVYVGDYKRMLELEQSGELDRLLKYNEGKTGGGLSTSTKLNTSQSKPAASLNTSQSKPAATSSLNTSQSKPAAGGSKFCGSCGTAVKPASKFCENCGKPVAN